MKDVPVASTSIPQSTCLHSFHAWWEWWALLWWALCTNPACVYSHTSNHTTTVDRPRQKSCVAAPLHCTHHHASRGFGPSPVSSAAALCHHISPFTIMFLTCVVYITHDHISIKYLPQPGICRPPARLCKNLLHLHSSRARTYETSCFSTHRA